MSLQYQKIELIRTSLKFEFKFAEMQSKSKRQKLGNSPYLEQQHQLQPDYSLGTLFYKKSKLNNSIYSPQEHNQLPDYQAENKKLNELIQTMKLQNFLKETQLKNQIQSLEKVIEQKQDRIEELEKKIIQIETLAQKKTESLKDKIIQCQEIVKQIQQREFKSSAHNMLETSRIEKFNILEQTTVVHKNLPENIGLTALNVNVEKTNTSVENVKKHSKQIKSVFYEEKKIGVHVQVPKRAKSPAVTFNYTPPKIVAPMSPVYRPQKKQLDLNSTINNGKKFNIQNRKIVPNYVYQNGFLNPIRGLPMTQNIITRHQTPQTDLSFISVKQNK